MERSRCHLCDKMEPTEEMQDIVVNGTLKSKACATHDIEDHVTSFVINEPPKKKSKAIGK